MQFNDKNDSVIDINYKTIVAISLLVIPVGYLFNLVGHSERYIFLLFIISVFFPLSLCFSTVSFIFIVSLFANVNFYYFSISELFSLFLLFSFLITYSFKVSEIKNKIAFFFSIFLISIAPSYLKLINNLQAFSLFLHLIYFFIVFTIFSITINDYRQIKNYCKVFLIFTLLNSFDVIIKTLFFEKRFFGFAGIMFVDYAGYAIIISFLLFIINKKNRLLYFAIFAVFVFALIFTQTRSIWIVSGLTLLMILVHLIYKGELYGFNKKKAIALMISIIVLLTIILFTAKGLNESVFDRLNVKKIEQTDNASRMYLQINSYVTRYFIWSTAWNAFVENPITGIGFYAFPFQSKDYSDLNPIIYSAFVKRLTPHETFLAVLTEAGLLGLTGFIVFLTYTVIFARKSISFSLNKTQTDFSLIIFWLSIYTVLSMIITDAWLWGHGLMLWGILLGVSIANRKLLLSQNNKLHLHI